MKNKTRKQQIGQNILAAFRAAGATEVAPEILLPSDTLLDLYGEDIRARAYVTNDPIRGEMMLRPDFTVPVVQMHMQNGADPARYCYLGEVFRAQDHGDTRPEFPRDNEYFQVGYELFARKPDADAEVFSLFHDQLRDYGVTPIMGDMGLIFDAVRALPISALRRETALHHIWRKDRFSRLLHRFATPRSARDFPVTDQPWTGLRSPLEMQARIDLCQQEATEPPLDPILIERLDRLFAIRGPAPDALAALRQSADEIPDISVAVKRLSERITEIKARGIDPQSILFDVSHGRETMAYYDGMTFSFVKKSRADWPPVASGGRYDALTTLLGGGTTIPAVGGIIRPGLLAELEQKTC